MEENKFTLQKAEEFRKDNRTLAGEGISFNLKMINDNSSTLRNTLLTLAIFLFGFSSAFLFKDITNVSLVIKVIILAAWFMLIVSIFAGICSFFVDNSFHHKLLEREGIRDNVWAKMINSLEDYSQREKQLASLNVRGETENSSIIPTIVQLLSLMEGLVLIFLATAIYMFFPVPSQIQPSPCPQVNVDQSNYLCSHLK